MSDLNSRTVSLAARRRVWIGERWRIGDGRWVCGEDVDRYLSTGDDQALCSDYKQRGKPNRSDGTSRPMESAEMATAELQK